MLISPKSNKISGKKGTTNDLIMVTLITAGSPNTTAALKSIFFF